MDTPESNNRDIGRILRGACNSPGEPPARGDEQPGLVRTSRLAVVACVLAVVGLLLLPGLFPVSARGVSLSLRTTYQLLLYTVSLSATVLGIVSLVRIGASAGRLVGKGFACVGVAAPAAQGLLFVVLALLARPTDVFMGPSCNSNLAGIGKAMQIYANDYEDEIPVAGGSRHSQWTGRIPDWTAQNRQKAYGLGPGRSGGRVSVSASLYLLVKYSEVSPKSFVCGSRTTSVYRGFGWTARTKVTVEEGVTEFRADTYATANPKAELTDFWDFGPNPPKHCSYAYQMVYGSPPLKVSSPGGFAILADRTPWMDSPSARARDFSGFRPDIAPYNGTGEQALAGNSSRHDGEGQNVLFLDGHVKFENRSFCGLDDDNIYTVSTDPANGDPLGTPPKIGAQPAN
ncbi:MAG: hypothetical protein ACM3VT_18145, partial [Solirubrobacterales bacterium]